MYVVEQMIVYDDDIIVGSSASKQVPPYVSPSMSAFDLDDRLLKLLLMRSERSITINY
jgi:hypothetical protein